MSIAKSVVTMSVTLLLPITAGMTRAQDAGDGIVEGLFGYGDKTVEVSTTQDLLEAVDSKHNITVLLKGDITVTDGTPTFTGIIHDSPCWGDSHLFNLSNYVFKPAVNTLMWDLSFAPADNVTVGKVVRNGRAEFYQLRHLNFTGIHNVSEDVEGTFTPFQPVAAEGALTAAADTTACYGYGGVFRSVSELATGESGGVYIHDNEGAIRFSSICYDGSTMGDVNCGISLRGGVIYADPEWNVEINRNGRSLGAGISFDNVGILLDRSAKYANSSQCYFYAYGGAIYTDDLSIDENYGSVSFNKVTIRQNAVHHDEGYGYGGALYLNGSNSISRNTGNVSFLDGGITVANTAKGGAVFLADGSTLEIAGNEGEVRFTGNIASAAAIDGTLNDDALAQGGAIYLSENSHLSICGNSGNVSFSSNEARATATESGAAASAEGGAIRGATGSRIDICGNRSVFFIDNTAATGSAIYTQGTLSIRNNAYVIVEGNAGDYAVYLEGASSSLQLSAARGASICLDDSLYAEGHAELNADYDGLEQQGTIELMSASATILGNTELHNGTLLLKQGSHLDVRTLNLLSSSATLAAVGKENTLTGKVNLAAGSTLALTLSSYNTSAAVLVLDGLLSVNETYTLDVSLNGVLPPNTEYILLDLKEYAYSEAGWREDIVRVTGDAAFSDLEWQNDYTRLVYRVPTVPEPSGGLLCLAALAALATKRKRPHQNTHPSWQESSSSLHSSSIYSGF